MRTADRILALVLGLTGLGLGLVVAAEVVQALLGRPGPLLLPYSDTASWLRDHAWSDGAVRTMGGALVVVGLLLVLLELKPRRKTLLVLSGDADSDVVTAVSRSGVGRAMEQSVSGLPGVDGTRSEVSRRTARLTVRTALRETGDLEAQVRERAGQALEGLSLVATPKLDVDLKEVSP